MSTSIVGSLGSGSNAGSIDLIVMLVLDLYALLAVLARLVHFRLELTAMSDLLVQLGLLAVTVGFDQ